MRSVEVGSECLGIEEERTWCAHARSSAYDPGAVISTHLIVRGVAGYPSYGETSQGSLNRKGMSLSLKGRISFMAP
jgi:hypothetical protein